jgi:broad specificity phosphatase PhoE
MKLHIVRHGETVWHAENRYAGSSDIDLTDLGLEQAERLALWAPTAGLDAIYSSDLSRAIKTALPSTVACSLDLTVDPRFREVHFGLAEGMTSTEMRAEIPEPFQAFLDNPAESPLPEGESGLEAVNRALESLFDISTKTPHETVLIVAHSTLGRLLLCTLTGIPAQRYRHVLSEMRNGAITTLEIPEVETPDALRGNASLLEFNLPAQPL